MQQEQKFSKTAIQALVVALLINLLAGAQYCWSMLGGAIGEQRGWTTTQLATPYSWMMVVTSLWAIVAGRINDKSKPKYMTMFGAVMICLALVVAGTTSSYAMVCIAIIFGMGLASTSFTSNTSPTAMKFAPAKYKGFVSGLVGAGMGWTSFYMAPMIRALTGSVGVTNTFIAIGVGCGGLIFILSFFLPTPPQSDANSPEAIAAAKAAEEADQLTTYKNTVDFKKALTTKETWILFCMFACAGMGGQMMTSQMTKIAAVQFTAGDAAAVAAAMVMALGLANGLGRLCVATLSDKLGINNTWRLIFVVQMVNILLFRFYTASMTLVVGTFVLGFFYGAAIPLVWSSVAGVFGRKHLGAIYGIITNGFSVAALAGPLISAKIVDTTGSYNTAFIVLAGFMLLGLALSFLMPKEQKAA